MPLKYFLPLILFAVCSISANAQQEAFEADRSNTMRVFDANGKLFENPNGDIAGSPFFMVEWKYGYVTLNNNKVYSKRLLRINFQSQEIHYLTENNLEMSLPAGSVKEIALIDSTKNPAMQYLFQSGFPPIDNQNEKNFYLFVSKGKISLLKAFRTNVIVDKNEFSGETNKEFRTYEDYYFFTGASIQKIKKDKEYITGLLKDKKENIEVFIKTNNLTCKSMQDIKKIIDYYNLLQ
jgi:hypothetical protein